MSQTFSDDQLQMLLDHLAAIVQVEFFTIPFYLTAVYSFTQPALDYSETVEGKRTSPLFALQQETLSVAVQEMYHLQLACNLANSFKIDPIIPTLSLPNTPIQVPHLDPGGSQLTAQLGNLQATIVTMKEIETPDDSPFPAPNPEVTYPSISDLYHATLDLLAGYMAVYGSVPSSVDPHFTPDHNQIAYGAFQTRYIYNKILNKLDVLQAANAISDQGEGNLVATPDQGGGGLLRHVSSRVATFFQFGDGDKVREEFQSTKGSRFYSYDQYTHYSRFKDVEAKLGGRDWVSVVGGPILYEENGVKSPDLPSWSPGLETLQSSLDTIWSFLIDTMQAGFTSGNLNPESSDPTLPGFNEAMMAMKYVIPLIWQWGSCPTFTYRAGVSAQETQAAMDAADPLCLFHWDAITAGIRAAHPKQMNACQGLNECASLGWGGIATEKGNGACATADMHSCQGTNSCAMQGGCGFLSTDVDKKFLPPGDQWIPGENAKATWGGCQTPIATEQVFDQTAGPTIDEQQGPLWTQQAKDDLKALMNNRTLVWDHARTLFQQAQNLPSLPTPLAEEKEGVDYDGTARRKAIAATSK